MQEAKTLNNNMADMATPLPFPVKPMPDKKEDIEEMPPRKLHEVPIPQEGAGGFGKIKAYIELSAFLLILIGTIITCVLTIFNFGATWGGNQTTLDGVKKTQQEINEKLDTERRLREAGKEDEIDRLKQELEEERKKRGKK